MVPSPSPPRTSFTTAKEVEAAVVSKPFISPDREVGVAGSGNMLSAGSGADGLGRRGPQAKVEPFQPTLAAFMS